MSARTKYASHARQQDVHGKLQNQSPCKQVAVPVVRGGSVHIRVLLKQSCSESNRVNADKFIETPCRDVPTTLGVSTRTLVKDMHIGMPSMQRFAGMSLVAVASRAGPSVSNVCGHSTWAATTWDQRLFFCCLQWPEQSPV